MSSQTRQTFTLLSSSDDGVEPLRETVPLLGDLQVDHGLGGRGVGAAEVLVLDGADAALEHGAAHVGVALRRPLHRRRGLRRRRGDAQTGYPA